MPRINDLIQKDLSYKIVGCLFKAQNNLGRYARESQYADILEKIFSESGLNYEREKKISKTGSDTNRADFVIENAVVVELKSKPFIEKNDYYQTKRYLEAANLKLGLLVNFRQKYLQPKRVLNSRHSHNLA